MSNARQMQGFQKGADLVLVAHGVRGSCAAASLGAHKKLVDKLRTLGRFNQIRWGYLACEPYVEDVVAGVRSETVKILPMLMSDGYFSKTVIPEKLRLHGAVNRRESGQQIIQCSPLGLSRMMADVMVAHILQHCNNSDLIANETAVIITGHGSTRDQASRLAVSMQVEYIRRLEKFKDVQAAFLEEDPGLPGVLRAIEGKALVMGYFANYGLHATKDVPALILESGSPAQYLGPVGALSAISEVVMACVDRATS